jgi:hypothetical protein
MVCDTQPQLARFSQERGHDVAIDPEDLYAVAPICFISRTRARASSALRGAGG